MKPLYVAATFLLALLLITPPSLVASSNLSQAVAILERDNALGEPQALCTTFSTVSKSEIVWLSAGHCVTNDESPEVIISETYTIGGKPAHILAANVNTDIAMFKSDNDAPRLMMANKPVKASDPIFVWGYPLSFDQAMFRAGTVASPSFKPINWPEGKMIMNISSANGDSGAPVLNSKDELVGMVTGGFCRVGNPFQLPVQYEGFCSMSGGIAQDVLEKFLTTRK